METSFEPDLSLIHKICDGKGNIFMDLKYLPYYLLILYVYGKKLTKSFCE